jgi:hypothetical protein
MNRNQRGLLLVHGAAVLLVGLLLGLAPSSSVGGWIAYVANIVTVGAGLFAGLLTLMGALGALKSDQ